jgi:hypothetical protein
MVTGVRQRARFHHVRDGHRNQPIAEHLREPEMLNSFWTELGILAQYHCHLFGRRVTHRDRVSAVWSHSFVDCALYDDHRRSIRFTDGATGSRSS